MSIARYPHGFNLAGPPRHVPLLVRSRLRFGGFCSQFGWFFFGFGMIFVWVFAMNSDVISWVVFAGPRTTAEGSVTHSDETRASEGGGDHSDGTPIYANHYRFTFEDHTYEGISYATGRRLPEGKTVTIEFPRGDPECSRIQGMRPAVFGPLVTFVVIFPLIGLCFIVAGMRRGRKAIRLLKHGR